MVSVRPPRRLEVRASRLGVGTCVELGAFVPTGPEVLPAPVRGETRGDCCCGTGGTVTLRFCLAAGGGAAWLPDLAAGSPPVDLPGLAGVTVVGGIGTMGVTVG